MTKDSTETLLRECLDFSFSLRDLGALCASAVKIASNTLTAETQRTQRWRRECWIGT